MAIALRLAAFALALAILPARAGDFADGMAGGPDYWQVSSVPAGDTLGVRASPSPRAAKLTQLRNGVVVRNRGCIFTRGQRWCRVQSGWANGRYLREGAGPQ